MKAWYRKFVRDAYSPYEKVPLWKGYVADDYRRNVVRVAPLGFNILFQIFYGVWVWLRIGFARNIRFNKARERITKECV